MKFLLHIDIEDESFGPIEFDRCPPIPEPGDYVTASDLSNSPGGTVEAIEYDYRRDECHVTIICTLDEDESQAVR
jgi:hypothetical protein